MPFLVINLWNNPILEYKDLLQKQREADKSRTDRVPFLGELTGKVYSWKGQDQDLDQKEACVC